MCRWCVQPVALELLFPGSGSIINCISPDMLCKVLISGVCARARVFIGGASEEEEEVGGGSAVHSAVGSVGSGYSSRHRPHLQHREGRSALHSGTSPLGFLIIFLLQVDETVSWSHITLSSSE